MNDHLNKALTTLHYTHDGLAQNIFNKNVQWSMAWSLMAIGEMLENIQVTLNKINERLEIQENNE